jgi:hypothetical protein
VQIPQVTLPPMPSGPSLFGPTARTTPSPQPSSPQSTPPQTPQQSQPTRTSLVGSVELGRPTPSTDPADTTPTAILPGSVPQIPANPTRAAPELPPPYSPPGSGMIVGDIQRVGAEQSFDSPRSPTTVRGQVEDGNIVPVQLSGPPPVPPPPPGGGGGAVPPLPPLPEGNYNTGVELTRPLNKSFGDQCAEFFGFTNGAPNGHCWFESDHAFDMDGMISPVTNPFLFEDPRSLTEIRPVWVFAKIPSSSSLGGGQAGFLGTQARLAFTPNFSVVMNKLGGIGLHPDEPNAAGVDGASGFAELNIGPKWTFWRCESIGMVAAAGATFQLPIGSSSVFQNTGTLGLDLYGTYGWNFLRTSWGSFSYLGSMGYDFGLDDKRSEFFHTHQQLSYDVLNLHHFYPLIEFNWYKYTRRGHETPFDFEGKDLFNFGASNAGLHSYFTIAPGARFKLNEHIQTGIATEFNLDHPANSLDKFRLTWDLIFRY